MATINYFRLVHSIYPQFLPHWMIFKCDCVTFCCWALFGYDLCWLYYRLFFFFIFLFF